MSRKAILIIGSLLIFTTINTIIWQKEFHIANATTIKIKLRPLDPRSIMQGDYMTLRYDFKPLKIRDLPKKGFLKLLLDKEHFITHMSLYEDEVLGQSEYLLQYTKKRYNDLHIGAESFLFEEGKADIYAKATHALFLLNAKGETLLKDLYIPSIEKKINTYFSCTKEKAC